MKIVCDHHILKLKFNDGVARSIRLEMIYFPNQEERKETIVYDLLNPTMYMCHVQLVLANYYWCILLLVFTYPKKNVQLVHTIFFSTLAIRRKCTTPMPFLLPSGSHVRPRPISNRLIEGLVTDVYAGLVSSTASARFWLLRFSFRGDVVAVLDGNSQHRWPCLQDKIGG